MDTTTVRQRLREATNELNGLEERRQALMSIIRGYEALVRLDGPPEIEQMPVPLALDLPSRGKGSISFRGAVRQVLRDARGEPLHVREIFHRTQGLGATTMAKDPVKITDLMIYSLINREHEPIRKVAPRTYRWAEAEPLGAPAPRRG